MSCFSSIQTKRLGRDDSVIFSPSMDLVVVGNQIIRYMSQQKLCTLPEASIAAWNRRSIAVANGKTLQLYDIEELLAQSEKCETLELPETITKLAWTNSGRKVNAAPSSSIFEKYNQFYQNDSEAHSLLCVTTSDGNLHLFQNGDYPVLTKYETGIHRNPDHMVVSPDASHIILGSGNQVSIYSLRTPPQPPHYSRVKQELELLSKAFHPLLASYKSSLAPLDQKLNLLHQLVQNYGLERPIPECLNEYVWLGQTADSNVVNIMDQFFTNVQLNDQLMVRLEASLSLVNVEKQLEPLLHVTLVPHLKSTQVLLLLLERLRVEILKARQRVADWIKWLRSAGSAVKARGTATNSVQKQNAKARRADDETVRHVRNSWKEAHSASPSKTENILGLRVHQLLAPHETTATMADGEVLPTIPYVLELVNKEVEEYFAAKQPRVNSTTFTMTGKTAVTCRLGESFMSSLPGHRQWCLSATAGDNQVALCAFPLTWIDRSVDLEDDTTVKLGIAGRQGHVVALGFPEGSVVRDVGFYGDDGKSSLVSKANGKEGRQKLGVLLQNDEDLELWLIHYDHLSFSSFVIDGGHTQNLDPFGLASTVAPVEPANEDMEEDEDPSTAYARIRVMGGAPDDCRLVLNGSRGVGAVLSRKGYSAQMEILDLEDDEEEDEDEMDE